jgi:hypothetical protein
MEFCSPFDKALAHTGPAAVFLIDRGGELRSDATWTRDAWGRAPGPHEPGWRWLLLRDHGSGFVQLILVTSPTLIVTHPRADVRAFESFEAASEVRQTYGHPAIAKAGW